MPPEGRVADLAKVLNTKFQEMKEQVRKTLYNAVISTGGLLIRDDGELRVDTASGVQMFLLGRLISGGTPFRGFILRRENGSYLFYTNIVSGDPNKVFFAWLDNQGAILVSDDAVSGSGLGRPYIPMAFKPATWTEGFAKTTSGSWTTVIEERGYKQHPRVALGLRVGAVGGVAGEWQVLVNGTAQASGSIPTGSFAINYPVLTVPGSHMSAVSIDVQLRVTSGSGNVGALVREAYGMES